MDSRKIVSIRSCEVEFTLALTDDQVRLLEWLQKEELFLNEVYFQVMDSDPIII